MSNADLRISTIGAALINSVITYCEGDVSEAIAWVLVSLITLQYHYKVKD